MGRKRIEKQGIKKGEAYYQDLLKNANVYAFLQTIRNGEGTLGADGYYKHFGGGSIQRLDIKPQHQVYDVKTKSNKVISSSAVGAFQFLNSKKHPYWEIEANHFGWNDILPVHQEIGALHMIDDKGAIQDILKGDIVTAINKTNSVWASLPGATYNQPTQNLASALLFYQENGGSVDSLSKNTMILGLAQKHLLSSKKHTKNKIANTGLRNMRIVTPFSESGVGKLNNKHVFIKDETENIPFEGSFDTKSSLYPVIQVTHQNKNNKISNPKSLPLSQVAIKGVNNMPLKGYEGIKPIMPSKPDDLFVPVAFDTSKTNFFTGYPQKESGWNLQKLNNNGYKSLNKSDLLTRPGYPFSDYTITANGITKGISKADSALSISFPDDSVRSKKENMAEYAATDNSIPNGSAKRMVNINLNTPIIGNFTIHKKDTDTGIYDLKQQIEEVILEILNSANAIQ